VNDRKTSEILNIQNKTHFDQWAKSYDQGRMKRWFLFTQSLVINELSLRKNSKILDVGCGTGAAVFLLADLLPEGKACGIDISDGMIQKAQAKIPREMSERIEFREGSSDKIPYPDEFFDGLICTSSFHHYPDPIKALKEMQRILKPGGEVLIFDAARDLSLYVWLWDRFLRTFEKGHICYYTTRELEKLLRESGLENLKLCHARNYFLKYGKIFASMQLWYGKK